MLIEQNHVFEEWAAAEGRDLASHLKFRKPLLDFFLLNNTKWYSADFTLSELGDVRTINYFAKNNPTRVLRDFFPINPEYWVSGFSIDAMIGRPILVAQDYASQPCMLDGYHRSCEILRNHSAAIIKIPVYLGICPNLLEWSWYE